MTRLGDIYNGGEFVYVCIDCNSIFGCAEESGIFPTFCKNCTEKKLNKNKCPKNFPPDTWVKKACCGC